MACARCRSNHPNPSCYVCSEVIEERDWMGESKEQREIQDTNTMSQRIHLISDREYCDPTDDFLALERALRAEQLAEHQERLMDEQRDREAERHDEGGEP